ncbi:MAG: L-threonylcarbamoyladenylate synthase [Alphaproteobacteria bacterium]
MDSAVHRPVEATGPAIQRAGAILRAGSLVALPTETVYGLAADATRGEAVARIFAAKGRPRFNPLIVHVASLKEAAALGVFSETARRLAETFWPGPLTLVLPRRPDCGIADLASAGLDTLALRVPAHPVMSAVIVAAGRPLAAPSANPSGQVSPTRAEHVAQGLGHAVDMILDGGPCSVGVESTVLAVDDDRVTLLRPGGLSRERIEAVVGPLSEAGSLDGAPRSPGQLARHYAPRARLRLNADAPRPGEAFIGFGAHDRGTDGPLVRQLSETGDLLEAAANLFSTLRDLDDQGVEAIAVAPIPETGLGEAINDRLRRAALGRDEKSREEP